MIYTITLLLKLRQPQLSQQQSHTYLDYHEQLQQDHLHQSLSSRHQI